MHPIERLRYVARAGPVPVEPLVQESSSALSAFADDPRALLVACRRLLDRRPQSAPLVWLTARMLTSTDPRREALAAVDDLRRDPTARELAHVLPDDARVVVIGAPDITGRALARRADLTVMCVEAPAIGPAFAIDLLDAGLEVIDVPESGMGEAVAAADLVLIESECVGPDDALAPPGSRAAAATAADAGVPVWLVAGVGRWLPERMWDGVLARVDRTEPWERDQIVLPLRLVDSLVGPDGPVEPGGAGGSSVCPVAPELFGSGRGPD